MKHQQTTHSFGKNKKQNTSKKLRILNAILHHFISEENACTIKNWNYLTTQFQMILLRNSSTFSVWFLRWHARKSSFVYSDDWTEKLGNKGQKISKYLIVITTRQWSKQCSKASVSLGSINHYVIYATEHHYKSIYFAWLT